MISVAIFAHNEAKHIRRSIRSITSNLDSSSTSQIVLLANGCSDDTENIVADIARTDSRVTLVSIAVGDKCNAWNEYVHNISEDSEIHYFTDGDCWVKDGSFDRMSACIRHSTTIKTVAGLPFSGRSRTSLTQLVTKHRLVLGNLYAVRGSHLLTIRKRGIKLPVGLMRNDNHITKFMWSNPDFDKFIHKNVIWDDQSGFKFDSLSPFWPPTLNLCQKACTIQDW